MQPKLNFWAGSAYAIGSIMGSGILFLPILTVSIAGSDALLAWILSTIICIPILLILRDMLTLIPNATSVDSFVREILGKKLSLLIPYLFIATVSLGMPAAALIAGQYVQDVIGGQYTPLLTGGCIITIGLIANLYDLRLSASINKYLVLSFILIALALIYLVIGDSVDEIRTLNFRFNVSQIFKAALLSFWAFAGFENLTFISNQFSKGAKGFYRSSFFALIICGALYLMLALAAILITKNNHGAPLQSLLGLIQHMPSRHSLGLLLANFAFFAVLINQISWTKGICTMIAENAKTGAFPRLLAAGLDQNRPKNAFIVFSVTLLISMLFQFLISNAKEFAISTVSANFVVIYLICLLTYAIAAKSNLKRAYAILISVPLIGVLGSAPLTIIYPTTIALIAYSVASQKNNRAQL